MISHRNRAQGPSRNISLVKRKGFTLIEVVLGVALFAILIGSVIGFADQSMRMSRLTLETEQKNLVRASFFEFLGNQFEELPMGATYRMETEETSSHLLHRMIFQGAPVSFAWGGQPVSCQAMEIQTQVNRGGLVDIHLRYYGNPIYDPSNPNLEEQEPLIAFTLLEDLWLCEFEVYNVRQDEWTIDWEVDGQMPSMLKMTMQENKNHDPIVHHFRVLEKQQPN